MSEQLTQTQHHIKLSEESLQKQTTTINLGPTHPATHGVFQNIMEIDGALVTDDSMTFPEGTSSFPSIKLISKE